MEVEVKESSKKRLIGEEYMGWSCEKHGRLKMEARKTEIAMGDCIKGDIERVGEEWNKLQLESIGEC